MKYDYYYERAVELTFNANLEQVLYLMEHYENEEDSDHFYNVLYAIVEKEKYLQKNYDYHSMLIDKLDDNSKEKLKEMFYEKTGNYDQAIDYFSELDKDYEQFFEKKIFSKKTWFSITTKKYGILDGEIYFSDRIEGPIEHDLETRVYGEKIDGVKGIVNAFSDIDPKYVWVLSENEAKKPIWKLFAKKIINKKLTLVDKNTGEVIPCPLVVPNVLSDNNLPHRMLDFIVYKNNLSLYDVYNTDFEKIDGSIDFIKSDNKKGYLLVHHVGDKKTQIYDGNYKQIGSISNKTMNYIITNDNFKKIYSVNDGIISLNTNERVIYYDYLNNKEVDSFLMSNRGMYRSCFAYSEGLYNFIDKNGLQGYKDLDGNVVINPKYLSSNPFLCNVSLVFDENSQYILDKNKVIYPYLDVIREVFNGSSYARKRCENFFQRTQNYYWHYIYSIEPDIIKQMYRISCNNHFANIIGHECYVMNDDTPIIEIKFENEEKVMKKK